MNLASPSSMSRRAITESAEVQRRGWRTKALRGCCSVTRRRLGRQRQSDLLRRWSRRPEVAGEDFRLRGRGSGVRAMQRIERRRGLLEEDGKARAAGLRVRRSTKVPRYPDLVTKSRLSCGDHLVIVLQETSMPTSKKEGEIIVAIALDPDLHKKLHRRAEKEERTIKATVTRAIREYLKTPLSKS